MNPRKILVCTVGGSDAPVVTAVRSDTWDHVLFVCTADSEKMITDGVMVQERKAMPAATRPSVPAQAGIMEGAWSTLTVPADNPDGVYAALTARLALLRRAHDGARVTVDFTGGTKSMSAGAMLAVAASSGTAAQVTTGDRNNLVSVEDGTQRAVPLAIDRIVLDRQIELLRETWRNFGYQEAADGFTKLRPQASELPDLERRLKFWADLGERFAAWDRFDRTQAAKNLQQARRNMPEALLPYAALAEQLREDAEKDASALLLVDLLRNAQRCEARGRHDDAVARCYRLWEWTVQWLLLRDSDIRTNAVDPANVPPEIIEGLRPDKHGRYQIGSDRAWKLYRALHPGSEAAVFWSGAYAVGKTHQDRYRALSQIRNASILAHGARPIDAQDSAKILQWTSGPFIEMIIAAASRLGEPHEVPQLPTELPEPVEIPARPKTE